MALSIDDSKLQRVSVLGVLRAEVPNAVRERSSSTEATQGLYGEVGETPLGNLAHFQFALNIIVVIDE